MGQSRAVLTGGAGYLGNRLRERLLEHGYEGLCVDNFSTGTPPTSHTCSITPASGCCACDVTDYLPVSDPVAAVQHFASP